jgi:putative flippase GtrA
VTDPDSSVTATVTTAVQPAAGPRLLPHDMVKSVILRRGVRQFVKFGIVGASGLLVNFILFTILQRAQATPAQQAAHYSMNYSISFLSGGVSNYFLNRIWTFRSSGHAVKQGFQFITVSLVALVVGLIVTKLLVPLPQFGPSHRTWLAATLCGIVVNFFANKYWTFKES